MKTRKVQVSWTIDQAVLEAVQDQALTMSAVSRVKVSDSAAANAILKVALNIEDDKKEPDHEEKES